MTKDPTTIKPTPNGSAAAIEMALLNELETRYQLTKSANNLRRVGNARPANWQNPTPTGPYNLVVIGGGSAGLVTSIVAAGLGARVAVIEKHLMGGDCLNTGCVPSKAVIRSAKVMGELMHAREYGIEAHGATVHFGEVMERVRRVQADLSPNDSVWRYRDAGVDVFLGAGKFTGSETIAVEGEYGNAQLKFKKALISTGSRAFHPNIPGLVEAGFLTNETVFNLTAQPRRLAVVGGGPIGCEFAQSFRRLGCEVVLLHNAGHLLNREDADAAEIVQQVFLREGIKLVLNSKITQVTVADGAKVVHFETPAGKEQVVVDEILVATGRVPNVENLGLEAVGVQADSRNGVVVNDYLQSSNPLIFAAGDVAMVHKFTHAASAAARIVLQNALFYKSKKLSALKMPWCTYTDPEIAHVGLYAHDAEKQGITMDTYTVDFDDNDRAVADGESEGFVKVHTLRGSDKILGATIVARAAGEMLNEITLAMHAGIGLGKLGDVIHPYPTQAEAIARVAGQYTRTRLTPAVKTAFNGWLKFNRRG